MRLPYVSPGDPPTSDFARLEGGVNVPWPLRSRVDLHRTLREQVWQYRHLTLRHAQSARGRE